MIEASPPSPELAEYLAFAHRLADAAAEVIRPLFRAPIATRDKSARNSYYDPVTEADRAAETAMRELIEARYPDHGIEGEEFAPLRPGAEYVWCLDPIDGTKSFVVGYPTFGTLIALNRRGRVELGIMNQPITNERFVGAAGRSRLAERAIATRACPEVERAILAFSGPWLFTREAEKAAIETLSGRALLTMYTGDCYNYCLLAMGRIDLIVEAGMRPYDIQALIPIVRGAGGVVTTWDGGPPEDGGWIVAAGDASLHAKVLPLLAAALPDA